MADYVSPGDVFVDNLMTTSSRGTFDLTGSFLSASVYESIFKPGIFAEFVVLDVDDALGVLKLSGDETVNFSFRSPNGNQANYNFSLNNISIVQGQGAMKGKTYTLDCISTEVLHAKANHVEKSYINPSMPISSIVQDVFKTFLHSGKSLYTELTKGVHDFPSIDKKPFHVIDILRQRAVSALGNKSGFHFFENGDGYHFRTMDDMMKQGVVKSFKMSDALGSGKADNTLDNNIIYYTILAQLSAVDRISMGALKQEVKTFDTRTRHIATKTIIPEIGNFISDGFKQLFGSTPGKKSLFQVTGRSPQVNYPGATPDQLAYAANMIQLVMSLQVIGDPILNAGKMIHADIPSRVNITNNQQLDPLVTGDFLISKVRHHIDTSDKRPRYTSILEVLKGDMANGI